MTDAPDNSKRCVLTVDTDRVVLALLGAHLKRAGYEVMQASCAEQALHAITVRRPDLVVMDVSLHGMSGIELARKLRSEASIPFMFLSSSQDAAIVRQAAQEGAVGYLVKPVQPAHLVPAIEAALTRAEEIHHLRQVAAELTHALQTRHDTSEQMRRELDQLAARYEEELNRLNARLDQAHRQMNATDAYARELARLANEDPVTGIANRNWMMNYLPSVIERAKASGGSLALLYIDLDGFKKVNDSLGHPAGDELLRAAALRMKSSLKPGDGIARQGGDEFVVVVEQVQEASDAAHVAQRMGDVLKNPFELFSGSCSVGASIGISLFPQHGNTAEELLRNADQALYRAKSEGKGRYCFYEADAACAAQAMVAGSVIPGTSDGAANRAFG